MKTVDEVFELIEIREDASDAVLSWRIGPAWKLTEAEKVYVEATKNLRTAIEELHRDATRLEWAMHYIPGAAWRHVGVNYNAGCTREDIDAAIDAAMEST